MALKNLDGVDVRGKKILVRIDINAAVAKGKVLDSPRFAASAETIKELLQKKARVVVIAHQGRKGDVDFLPLEQHARILSKHVGKKISYVNDLFGEQAKRAISTLQPGQGILLENVRNFDDETNPEKKDNQYNNFCKLFDIYVNDAFSVSHRAQGSIVLPPRLLPSVMGRNLEREVHALEAFRYDKKKRTVFLIGGAKIDDYLPLFAVLENKNAKILASGVLGNLLLMAQGHDLGYEREWSVQQGYDKHIAALGTLLQKYPEQIIVPLDFAVGEKKRKEVLLADAPFKEKLWDVGKQTVELFKQEIDHAEAVLMKGPLGYSELKAFSYGTVEILKHVASLTKKKKVFSLLGGGHLTTTIETYKLPETFSYISLSGGALLQSLAGKQLPGIVALEQSKN